MIAVRVGTTGELGTATVKKIRSGYNEVLSWEYGSESTAPAAGTALVTHSVGASSVSRIYGFVITAQEANDFKLEWTQLTASKSLRIALSGAGTVAIIADRDFNLPWYCDLNSSVTIKNQTAGTAGKIYQAAILTGKV